MVSVHIDAQMEVCVNQEIKGFQSAICRIGVVAATSSTKQL